MERPVVVDCLEFIATITKGSTGEVCKIGQYMHSAPGLTAPEKLTLKSEFQPAASAITPQR
jgi:hypothetical protein